MGDSMNRVLTFSKSLLEKEYSGLNMLGKFIKIIIILVLIRISVRIAYVVIDKTFQKREKNIFSRDKKKVNTLATVFKNMIKYIFYFIGLVMILDMFNINTASILATAGIGGLAIGFGAQSLVKDIITGFFILFENQFSVGDYVKIGDYDGIVEELGVRVTKIRAFSGELHIIPNSNIDIVTNGTKGNMRALVSVTVPYEEDIDRVSQVLNLVCKDLSLNNKNIVEGPSLIGVSNLGEHGLDFTIVARTKPMEQWGVEREIRKKIKEAFDKEGIKISYPRRIYIRGE